MIRPSLYRWLLAASLASAAAAPPAIVDATEDLNGDRAVNVLDLQQIVAQLLDTGVADRPPDVNGDGVIDILDVQRILARTAEARDPEDNPSENSSPKSTPPITFSLKLPLVQRCASIDLPEAPSGAARRWERRDTHPPIVCRHRERYLYVLTPNAPPIPG